ncbi:hypothetical protein Ancab_011674 [Ancistrocladus abbreviatus]
MAVLAVLLNTQSKSKALVLRHLSLFSLPPPSVLLFSPSGLSYDTNETILRDAFIKYGQVIEVRVICDHVSGNSRGYGFVKFTSETAASSARKEMNNQELLKLVLVLQCRYWMGETFVYIMQTSSDLCFKVVYDRAIPSLCQLSSSELSMNRITGTFGCLTTSKPLYTAVRFSSELFISRLSFYTTSEELKKMFSPFGVVKEARLVMDPKTRRNKGYGFVTFENEVEAKNALEALNGRIVAGRLIFVEFAENKRDGKDASSQN